MKSYLLALLCTTLFIGQVEAQFFQKKLQNVNAQKEWYKTYLRNPHKQTARTISVRSDAKPKDHHEYSFPQNVQAWELYAHNHYTYDEQWQQRSWIYYDHNDAPQSKSLYDYTMFGEISDHKFLIWNNGASTWDSTTYTTRSYDEYNNLAQEEYKNYNPTTQTWELFAGNRYESSYNHDGLMTGQVISFHDGKNWIAYEKHCFTYDNFANLIADTLLSFGTTWDTTDLFLFVYDDVWNELSEIEVKQYDHDQWNNVERFTDIVWAIYEGETYFWEDGKYLRSKWQTWDPALNQYVDVTKDTIVYPDANGSYIKTIEANDNSVWIPIMRETQTYDDYNNITHDLLEYIDPITNDWKADDEYTYANTYDAEDNLTEVIVQKRFPDLGLINFRKHVYSNFNNLTEGINNKELAKFVNIYPNPTQGESSLKLNLQQNANVSIAIYNTLGAKVKQLNPGVLETGTHEINLRIKDKGIFLVRVMINDQPVTLKLIHTN